MAKRWVLSLLVVWVCTGAARAEDQTWAIHTIDPSTKARRGADGIRLADANGDGLLDTVTGWEQGNAIRVCLNPGANKVKSHWPAVTVGEVADAEDAVFADLDGDGALDVVSSCEGKTMKMFVHWAPKDAKQYLNEKAWRTKAIPATEGASRWMYALPMQVDGKNGIDLIVGSKSPNGMIGLLLAPANPRDLSGWKLVKLYAAAWIMNTEAYDMDHDGDLDIVTVDRKGDRSGILWLENPGTEHASHADTWKEHRIGPIGYEPLFMDVADLDSDGALDIITSTRNDVIRWIRRQPGDAVRWKTRDIPNPFGVHAGKSVRVADINLDGKLDLVHTTNTNVRKEDKTKVAVAWMSYGPGGVTGDWTSHAISPPGGAKYDLIQLLDLDGDGDLDLMCCEENAQLGVFWYENPTR
jgi:hypothetical protein